MSGILRRKSTGTRETASQTIKITLLGKKGVGKSAITVRLLTKRFIGEYDPDLEASYKYSLKTNGEDVIAEVMDTAERDCDDRIQPCAQWADCFVLVYAANDIHSFEEMVKYKTVIDSFAHCNFKPLVIVANKLDLLNGCRDIVEQGSKFASEIGCPFYEISARDSYDDVERVFRSTIDLTSRCMMIKDQISRFYGSNSRKGSFKGIMNRLARQKSVKEDIWEERPDSPPKRDQHNCTPQFPSKVEARERSHTCTF